MTVDQFRDIRAKAGGIIILLPENVSVLSSEEKQVRCLRKFAMKNRFINLIIKTETKKIFQHIYMLEQAIMAQEISIPVYFSRFNAELNNIIDEISSSKEKQETSKNKKRESAISEIVNSISANGYQVSDCFTPMFSSKIFFI